MGGLPQPRPLIPPSHRTCPSQNAGTMQRPCRTQRPENKGQTQGTQASTTEEPDKTRELNCRVQTEQFVLVNNSANCSLLFCSALFCSSTDQEIYSESLYIRSLTLNSLHHLVQCQSIVNLQSIFNLLYFPEIQNPYLPLHRIADISINNTIGTFIFPISDT